MFISYASEDYDLAVRFKNDLTYAGLDPWIDKESLQGGAPWKEVIEREIRNSGYFIPLLSRNSVENKGYVNKEWQLALEYKNQPILEEFVKNFVIPVKLDDYDISHMHKKIKELHVIDLSKGWEKGIRNVIELIESLQPKDEDRERDIKELNEMGSSRAKVGKHPEAIIYFSMVIRLDPSNIMALDSRGYSLAETGKHKEAIEDFDKVIQIDPSNVRSWLNKGYSWAARGKYWDAIKCFDRVIGIEPMNSVAWANKGYSYMRLGNRDKAKESYRRQKEIERVNSSGKRKFLNLFRNRIKQ